LSLCGRSDEQQERDQQGGSQVARNVSGNCRHLNSPSGRGSPFGDSSKSLMKLAATCYRFNCAAYTEECYPAHGDGRVNLFLTIDQFAKIVGALKQIPG
jgi:hypothetical protein